MHRGPQEKPPTRPFGRQGGATGVHRGPQEKPPTRSWPQGGGCGGQQECAEGRRRSHLPRPLGRKVGRMPQGGGCGGNRGVHRSYREPPTPPLGPQGGAMAQGGGCGGNRGAQKGAGRPARSWPQSGAGGGVEATGSVGCRSHLPCLLGRKVGQQECTEGRRRSHLPALGRKVGRWRKVGAAGATGGCTEATGSHLPRPLGRKVGRMAQGGGCGGNRGVHRSYREPPTPPLGPQGGARGV